MLTSGLIYKKNLLIDILSEQLFQNIEKNDTVENNLLNITTLTSLCLSNILTNIKLIEERLFNDVVIDLDGILNTHNLDYLFDSIIDYFTVKSKNIFIINIHENLYNQLKFEKYKKAEENKIKKYNSRDSSNVLEHTIYNFFIKGRLYKNLKLSSLIDYKYQIYNKLLFEKLITNKSYYGKKEDKLSNSSDVYLEKYINIKAFIEDKRFSNYGLFLLSKKIIDNIQIHDLEKQYLFTMSINGSYLATIISRIIGIEFSFIDHLGPINKIYKTQLDKRITPESRYIIVSDVICLGTEIKIAESIINYENAIVNGNATIINIKTVSRIPKAPILCLFELNAKTNKKLRYTIKTELSKK